MRRHEGVVRHSLLLLRELPQDSESIHTNQHWCDLKHDGAEVEEREQEDDTEDSRAPGFTPSSAEANIVTTQRHVLSTIQTKKQRNTSGLPDEES